MRVLSPCRSTLLVLAAVLTGCGQGELVRGVTDSTYVRAMVALRHLPMLSSPDSSARIRMRDSVLRRFGVSAAQLESAAVVLSSQPQRAAALWQAIEQGGTSPQPATPPADK